MSGEIFKEPEETQEDTQEGTSSGVIIGDDFFGDGYN